MAFLPHIQKQTLARIFAAYFGFHCEYLSEDGKWHKTRVDADILTRVLDGKECRLLLKPLYLITVKEILEIEKMSRKLANEDRSEMPPEREGEYTDEEKKALREHFLDTEIYLLHYPMVDFLRRIGYHIDIYGLNLFKIGLARRYNHEKETVKP